MMTLKKTLTTGALALSVSFAGLAVGAAGCASTKSSTRPTSSVEGAQKKCGSGSCGAKSDQKKKVEEKKGVAKGADKKCGASKCGKNSCG